MVTVEEYEQRKDNKILLGQAMNQANAQAMQHKPTNFIEFYKKRVRIMYEANRELVNELLPKLNIETKEEEKPVKPTQKQKECPNCKELIPKSWQFHKKCGWKQ